VNRPVVLELSAAPSMEDCAQVGEEDYEERGRAECRALRRQLLRAATIAGITVPETVSLFTKSNSHDFGTYYEVAVRFPEDDRAAAKAAYWFEGNMPARWDSEARTELGLEP